MEFHKYLVSFIFSFFGLSRFFPLTLNTVFLFPPIVTVQQWHPAQPFGARSSKEKISKPTLLISFYKGLQFNGSLILRIGNVKVSCYQQQRFSM